MFVDPGGSDQFCSQFDLKTSAGSKPLIEYVDQVRSALSANEPSALGLAICQEMIELVFLDGLFGKFRVDRQQDRHEVKFEDHRRNATAGQHRS